MADEIKAVEDEVMSAGAAFIAEGKAKVEEALGAMRSAADHMGPAMVPVMNAVRAAVASALQAVLEHVSGAIHPPAPTGPVSQADPAAIRGSGAQPAA